MIHERIIMDVWSGIQIKA